MSTKKLLILVGILIILGLLYLTLKNSENSGTSKPESVFLFNKDNITGIQISEKDKKLQMSKKDNRWVFTDEPYSKVNGAEIDKSIDMLLKIKEDNLVATQKTSHGKYGIDTNSVVLTLTGKENDTFSLVIGKTGPDYRSNYIKKDNSDNIYLVNQSFRQFKPEKNNWIDRMIYRIDSDKINNIEIHKEKDSYIFTKLTPDTWSFMKNDTSLEISSKKIEPIRNKINSIYCIKYADKNTIDSVVYSDTAFILKIKADNDLTVLTFYKHNISKNDLVCVYNKEINTYRYILQKRVINTILNTMKNL